VVAIIKDNILYVANLGDSEMVLCTEGKSEILTECHNPKKNEKELQRVEAMGGRIIKGRVGHPRLNPSIFSIAVSRAIGDSFFKDPQVTEGRPSGLIAEPYITQRLIKESDEFLVLACDGVWDVLGYQDVVDYVRENLKKEKDPQKVSEMLCQLALDKGSTDNITALIVTFRNLN
jgi:serine/threonine protein phosphatase PrpC